MKLSYIFFVIGLLFFTSSSYAASIDISNIQKRGVVLCGTNKSNHDLAYKDENGTWRGFDATLCRAIAGALLGNKEKISMRPINIDDAPKALRSGKIDVMFGEFSLPAEMEITSNVLNMSVLYHEKVMLLAHKIEGATSLDAFQDAKVCMVRSSIDTYFLNNFIYKYKLKLQPLYYHSRDKAVEAFYLNRCTLLPGSSNELKTILNTKFKGKDYVELIPEVIGLRPVYAMVDKGKTNLGVTIKWIINALQLIDTYNINSTNLPMMMGDIDPSVQNLLGNKDELWKKFNIYPTWMRSFIAEEGNYREMYQRHLGPGTSLDLNEFVPEHGLAAPKPFI